MINVSKSKRRVFDASFKLQIVEMIRAECLSIGQVCRDMNLGESAVRRCLVQINADQLGQPVIDKPLTVEQQRIHRLESENRRLREVIDIVKKASAFFAQELR